TVLPHANTDPQGTKSFRLISYHSANHRFFQDHDEEELADNISTSFKFKKKADNQYDGKLTLGYNGRFKDISFEATQFNYQILNFANQPFVDPYNIDAYFEEYGPGTGFWQIRTFRDRKSVV